jgi:hypothetical protein
MQLHLLPHKRCLAEMVSWELKIFSIVFASATVNIIENFLFYTVF